jgi:hypothetical protein
MDDAETGDGNAFIDARMLRAHEMSLQYEWWIPKRVAEAESVIE